jgi:hypothetical protein
MREYIKMDHKDSVKDRISSLAMLLLASQGLNLKPSLLKMEAAGSSEMFVPIFFLF